MDIKNRAVCVGDVLQGRARGVTASSLTALVTIHLWAIEPRLQAQSSCLVLSAELVKALGWQRPSVCMQTPPGALQHGSEAADLLLTHHCT